MLRLTDKEKSLALETLARLEDPYPWGFQERDAVCTLLRALITGDTRGMNKLVLFIHDHDAALANDANLEYLGLKGG